MAFANRISNMLQQAVSKHVNLELSTSSSLFCLARRSMSSSSSKLFVGGLSYGTDEPSLKDAFSQYGDVIEEYSLFVLFRAKIVMDRSSGRSRGFGFVTYTSSEEASSAISALDGKDLHGRQIRVNYATEKRQGFRGGYSGGGGGYAGPGVYGNGSYGGAGYGGSNNYSGDGNYSRGSGYGPANYGSGGNYPIGNNSLGNGYSSGGNIGDLGLTGGGGGAADYFSGGSTNQGEPNAVVQDSGQDGVLHENYKDDDDEFSDQATTRS